MHGITVKEVDLDVRYKVAITHDKKTDVWRLLRVKNKRTAHETAYDYQRNVLSTHQSRVDAETALLAMIDKQKKKTASSKNKGVNLFANLFPSKAIESAEQKTRDVLEKNALALLRENSEFC